MTQPKMHPLAEQYLQDLRRLAASLPRSQRAEILEDVRAHLEAGLALVASEADVRNLLESLGSPEEVIAEAEGPVPIRVSIWPPLVLGLLGVATILPGMAALWVPVIALACAALALSAIWTGIRVLRQSRRTANGRWPATVGAGLGAFTLVTLIVWWTVLLTRTDGTDIPPARVVTASPAVNSQMNSITLQIRQVLKAEPAAAGTCPAPVAALTDPRQSMTACSADGKIRYRLAPSPVTGANVTYIAAEAGPTADESVIDVTLDTTGRASLVGLSKELASQSPPKSQMAIVIHGAVQSAATFADAFIDGTSLQIHLPIVLQQAQSLVDALMSSTSASTPALPACSTRRYSISRGLSAAVAKAITKYYTAEALAPITFDPATETEMVVSMNSAGEHRCMNPNGEEGSWIGTLPAAATEGVLVSVKHAPRPDATQSTWNLVTVAYIPGQGWAVVNEASSP